MSAREPIGAIGLSEVMRLETEVWQALVIGDPDADSRLLAADFLGVYPTGYAARADHVGQIAAGPTVTEFTLSEERLLSISDSAVLLAYRADYRRPDAAVDSDSEVMYVSSLWCRRDDRWLNVFSQDTPASTIRVP